MAFVSHHNFHKYVNTRRIKDGGMSGAQQTAGRAMLRLFCFCLGAMNSGAARNVNSLFRDVNSHVLAAFCQHINIHSHLRRKESVNAPRSQ